MLSLSSVSEVARCSRCHQFSLSLSSVSEVVRCSRCHQSLKSLVVLVVISFRSRSLFSLSSVSEVARCSRSLSSVLARLARVLHGYYIYYCVSTKYAPNYIATHCSNVCQKYICAVICMARELGLGSRISLGSYGWERNLRKAWPINKMQCKNSDCI